MLFVLFILVYHVITRGLMVAKYCNECVCLRVCLSVCLSMSIPPEPHARSLPNVLCMLPIAIAQSSGRVKGEGQLSVVVWAFKSIGYSLHQSLQRRCNRDHSVANNVMQQKGLFNVPGKCK